MQIKMSMLKALPALRFSGMKKAPVKTEAYYFLLLKLTFF